MQVGRRKGFSITFQAHQWKYVLVGYDVARARGHNSPDMDRVAAMIPNLREDAASVHDAMGLAALDVPNEPDYVGPPESFGNPRMCRSKALRVRGKDVGGLLQLLRYARLVCGWGSCDTVLTNRIEKLESISELDLLADASR